MIIRKGRIVKRRKSHQKLLALSLKTSLKALKFKFMISVEAVMKPMKAANFIKTISLSL